MYLYLGYTKRRLTAGASAVLLEDGAFTCVFRFLEISQVRRTVPSVAALRLSARVQDLQYFVLSRMPDSRNTIGLQFFSWVYD